NANAGNFNDAVKCNILKSMMGGKYAPVSVNNNLVAENLAINSPDTLRAIQRLTQEKYQPYDTSDTYKARIRPLLLGVADNDAQVLGFLKSHLTGDFYTWMRIANPAGINAFFTELKNMWLERAPNLNGQVSQQSSYNTKIIEAPIIPQSIEKLRKEVQSSKAQKTQTPVPQTVEPVRQPRGPPSNLKTEEDYKNYYVAKYLNDLGIYSNEDLDSHYPKKPFQKTNQSARMDRIESKVDEIEQITFQFGKMVLENQSKKTVAKLNRTQRYYSFQPINSSVLANEEGNDDKTSQPEAGSPLREKIINPLTKNKWVESLEYMQCKIEDIDIPETFSDTASECVLMNKALNNALGWDLGIAPNFILTHNSDHITKLIGGHKDVAISIKHKNGWLIVIVNIVVIDDKETDYLLCLGMPFIRKVKGIPDSDKHEFRMTVCGKSYIIPTFIKPNENINEKQPSSKISSCCTIVIRDTTQDTEALEPLEE
ncbi:6349_t:CDS:2, partial [Ambispora gerdemannii]